MTAFSGRLLLAVTILLAHLACSAQAQIFEKTYGAVRKGGRAVLDKKNPRAPLDPSVESLAKEIDWLEHVIETFGTVVPKQPDVWGEARLAKHRSEYEREIAKRFSEGRFTDTLQGAIRQSDQASLALAFALNSASATSPTTANSLIAPPSGNSSLVTLPSGITTTAPTAGDVARTAPLSFDTSNFNQGGGKLSLEPVIEINQLSRYLENLNNLRRVNEGGDTADSPGYALNLMRIPVSVLPGHITRKGHCAEITFTIKPYISDDLLPTTTRNLVINDIVELNSVPLAQLFNNNATEARVFLTGYWANKGRVRAWIEVYDAWLKNFIATIHAGELGDPQLWRADVEYLLNFRSYLEFRMVQIAIQATAEENQSLPCLDCNNADSTPYDSADGKMICPIWEKPISFGTPGTRVLHKIAPKFAAALSAFGKIQQLLASHSLDLAQIKAVSDLIPLVQADNDMTAAIGLLKPETTGAELQTLLGKDAAVKDLEGFLQPTPEAAAIRLIRPEIKLSELLTTLKPTSTVADLIKFLDPNAKAQDLASLLTLSKSEGPLGALGPSATIGDVLKLLDPNVDPNQLNSLTASDFNQVIVRLTARDAAETFDDLAEHLHKGNLCPANLTFYVSLSKSAMTTLRKGVASTCSQSLGAPVTIKFGLPMTLDELKKYHPGDLVDRHCLPFTFGSLDSPIPEPVTPRANPSTKSSRRPGTTKRPAQLSAVRPVRSGQATSGRKKEKRVTRVGFNELPEEVPAQPVNGDPFIEDPETPIDSLCPGGPDLLGSGPCPDDPEVDLFNFLVNGLQSDARSYHSSMSINLDASTPSGISDIFESGPLGASAPIHAGSGKRPLVASQMLLVYGFENFMDMAFDAYSNLRTNIANHKVVHVYDINQYLTQEARSAYEFLEAPENIELWNYCTPELAHAIDARDALTIIGIHDEFMRAINGATRRTVTAALAWAIIVDAALLNEQLIKDMTSIGQSKGCPCVNGDGQRFVFPKQLLTPDAHDSFKKYVLCRWPVIVFSLDPVADQQNVADIFSRRRDLQLAVAVAVAQGNVSPSAAGRFTRRLEMDMETIALNQTAVAFSHASDTFGWRFYPRVQSPDTPGTLVAFGQTLFGGPNRDHDLRDRQLEMGIHDCTAVVIMPSFVPYITISSRAEWFSITNPRNKELTLHDTMRLSRDCQAVRNAMKCTGSSNEYRPGDVGQMSNVLNQLEKKLPLQETKVEVPYLNTLGGFELFETGVDGLGPQLEGWYGAPGIDPDSVTTLYLIGKRFSVLETQVIVGGRAVPYRMLSRKVLEVTVPPGSQPLLAQEYKDFIDVQVGAPYGVSSHMLVPRVNKPVPLLNSYEWVTQAATVHIAYKAAAAGAALYASVTPAPQIQFRSPSPATASVVSINLTISELLPNGQEIVLSKLPPGSTSLAPVSARFDARSGRYVIDVDQLSNLIDSLKFAYAARQTDGLQTAATATWLLRASVGFSGGTTDEISGSLPLDVHFDAQ